MRIEDRAKLLEGQGPVPLSSIWETTGIPPIGSLKELLVQRSRRLQRELRLRENPFKLNGSEVSAHGVAGVIRLAPGVVLEVVPKCFDSEDSNWHDDFLLMALATKLGRVSPKEHVAARLREDQRDVLTLLAAMFLEEFQRLAHVPIREYRKSNWIDLNLDGDLEYSEVWASRPEGFRQTGLRLTAVNKFMGVIARTAAHLGGVSGDRGVGQRLQRLAAAFPGVDDGRPEERVPGRYARWQYLYDLAISIQTGLGVQMGQGGDLRALSFVLNTERGWEDLLTLTLTAQGSHLGARAKPPCRLGVRKPGNRKVLVHPDIVLKPTSHEEPIVVDAKYKGSAASQTKSISSGDLYQALAFLQALEGRLAILVYPGGEPTASSFGLGTLAPFESVHVDSRCVIGANVCIAGVGSTGGLQKFGSQLGHCILEIAEQEFVAL